MSAHAQEKSVRVRIIKKPVSKKDKTTSVIDTPAHYFEKKPSLPEIKETEHQKKKLIIGVSVSLIMLIIFLTWLSFIGSNLSHIKGANDGLWPKVTGYLKESFSGLKNSFEGLSSSVNQNSSAREETELEKSVFPETK